MERLRGCAAGIEGVVSREPRARPSSAPKVYPPRAPLVPVKGSLERANDVIKGGSSRTRRDETVPFLWYGWRRRLETPYEMRHRDVSMRSPIRSWTHVSHA